MNWNEYKKECYYLARNEKIYLNDGSFNDRVQNILNKIQDLDKQRAINILEQMISLGDIFVDADRKYRPILIYKSEPICYGVLNHFAEQMGKCLQISGYDVLYYDVSKEPLDKLLDYADKSYKAVIGFQTYLFSVKTVDGELLHDRFYGPKFNMILDHPCVMTRHILNSPKDTIILTHDRNYKNFIRKYFADRVNVEILAPAGEDHSRFNNTTKTIGLSFVGSYRDYKEWFVSARKANKKYNGLVNKLITYMRKHTEVPYEQVVEFFCDNSKNKEELIQIIYDCQSAYYIVMNYYRYKIIRIILDAGIELDVYGNSWHNETWHSYHNLHIHDTVYGEEVQNEYAKAWLSLNIMSWHKDGMTERIAEMMLAGTVAISDESTYLRENFSDNEIKLFDLDEIENLPQMIITLLNDKDILMLMAKRAREKAQKAHTWNVRAVKMCELIEKYNNIISG